MRMLAIELTFRAIYSNLAGQGMSPDLEILTALVREASRQSEPFQNLIHDYSAAVMNDPEVHRLFAVRLDADLPMRREIEILKASLRVSAPGGFRRR
jgi:hypothetical protein